MQTEQQAHPEWEKENSLTAPQDRDPESRSRPEQGKPVLTDAEAEAAMGELVVDSMVRRFPRYDRTYADPPLAMQHIGLFSFVPAKGAKPDEKGVYGFCKLRGNYATQMEAAQQAEFIVRNVDSYHSIYQTHVGRPFPVTHSSQYTAEVSEIDLRKETTEAVSADIKAKKKKDKMEVDEMKNREKELLAESKRTEEDPYDEYITARVKKAQLTWTYLEHQKKLAEVKDIIIKTREVIAEYDEHHPDFANNYYEKYMEARSEAGIKESGADSQDNFIKFLVEDDKCVLDF